MLKDKVAIITGGTRGIGLETARVFLENGAKVIIFGSRQATVDKALTELKTANQANPDRANNNANTDSQAVDGYFPDLGNFAEVEQTISAIHQKYGKIDILINNAGISANKKIEETTSEEFVDIMNLNVNAIFNTVKATVPFMERDGGGAILNTSSMVSLYGQPSGVGYPASKFAVNGLTKSLARELGPKNIRVNAVAPGITNTDMVASLPEEMIAPLVKTIPLGRIGEPRDIANAFLFLASDLATYVTGTILSVDGAARS